MELDFEPGEVFRGTRLYHQRDGLAYAYTTDYTSVDADGAPKAYHPADLNKSCYIDPHVGLDCLKHAGYPNTSWWDQVLVPDPDNPDQALVQQDGEAAGYFVSMTSLRSPMGEYDAPSTYVDASRVPFVVVPTGFYRFNFSVRPGDVGYAVHLDSGRGTAFIVADYGGGPDAKLGEASIALYEALGGTNVSAINGDGVLPGRYQYVLFPGSRHKGAAIWPRSNDDIAAQVSGLLLRTEGIGQFLS